MENDNVPWKCDIRLDSMYYSFWHLECATMSTNIDPAEAGLKVFTYPCQGFFENSISLSCIDHHTDLTKNIKCINIISFTEFMNSNGSSRNIEYTMQDLTSSPNFFYQNES